MPEATAAYFDGYNGGYDFYPSGPRKTNGAGIDLLPLAVKGLGGDPDQGFKDWVDVWWLWEPGSSIPPVNTNRIAGVDRYGTSELLMDKQFPKGAPAIVLATGANYPDALCGAPLASAYKGPLLLIDPKLGITMDLYNRFKTWTGLKKVYILGSSSVVATSVANSMAGLPSKPTVTRLDGVNRYETCAKIAEAIEATTGAVDKMVVATGENYPDALSVGPLAATRKWPIILVTPGGMPARVAQAVRTIKPAGTLIVGGTGAVSQRVQDTVPSPLRLAGSNRWETNVAVAGYAARQGSTFNYVGVVNGVGYADALSAGAYLGKLSAIELLVEKNSIPMVTYKILSARREYVRNCDIIGGTAAINAFTEANLRLIMRP